MAQLANLFREPLNFRVLPVNAFAKVLTRALQFIFEIVHTIFEPLHSTVQVIQLHVNQIFLHDNRLPRQV